MSSGNSSSSTTPNKNCDAAGANNNLARLKAYSFSCRRIIRLNSVCESDVAHEILPNLWLGSKHAASVSCHDQLYSVGITSIINMCASEVPTPKEWNSRVLNIPAQDTIDYDLEQHLEEVLNFIKAYWSGGGDDDDDSPFPIRYKALTVTANDVSETSNSSKQLPLEAIENNAKESEQGKSSSSRNEGPEGTRGGILIHCKAGVSRSAAMLAAVLSELYVDGKSGDVSRFQALRVIQQKRHIVDPNSGFMKWLLEN